MMMMNGGMMNFGMIFYLLFIILIFGFLIYGVLLLITKLFNKNSESSILKTKDYDSSMQILKERFAKGEISEAEFEHKYTFLKEKQ